MKTNRVLAAAMALALLTGQSNARAEDLPADARKVLERSEQELKAIQQRFEQEIKKVQQKAIEEVKDHQEKLIKELQALQDRYTKDGKLDAAVAIRDRIRAIKAGLVSGRRVEVLYASVWWKAEVLEEKEGKYYVHYEGYGDTWNEWVTRDRLRPLSDKEATPEKK
jgi:Skp family chaperone for outer membrane proteins